MALAMAMASGSSSMDGIRGGAIGPYQLAQFVTHAEVGAGDAFTRERAEADECVSQLAVKYERVSQDDDAYRAVVEQNLHGDVTLALGHGRAVRGVDCKSIRAHGSGDSKFEIRDCMAEGSSVSEAKCQVEVNR